MRTRSRGRRRSASDGLRADRGGTSGRRGGREAPGLVAFFRHGRIAQWTERSPYTPPRKSKRARKWRYLPARFLGCPAPRGTVSHACPSPKLRPAGKCLNLAALIRDNLSSMITLLLHVFRLLPFLSGDHRQLALENLALRHQVAMYKRTVNRPSSARLIVSTGLVGQVWGCPRLDHGQRPW
jgi:hypothetical protein